METEKKDNIKIKAMRFLSFIASWIFGVFFLLTALVIFHLNPSYSILFLLMSLAILPPVNTWVKKKFNLNLSLSVKFLTIFAIFILINFIGPSYETSETENKDTIQATQKEPLKSIAETITLNLCKTDPDNADYWKDKNVNLFEKPNEGKAKQIPACASLELKIIEKKTVDNVEFYKVEANNIVGWQTKRLLDETVKLPTSTETIQQPAIKDPVESKDTASSIEATIQRIGDYSITIYGEDGNFANDKSEPPFEVIVIAGQGQIPDCFEAKHQLFEVMESLYNNPKFKGKISRVTFSAFGQLRASLGAKDAAFNWEDAGPTMFWTTLLQYNAIENETGPINERTWGVNHNDC